MGRSGGKKQVSVEHFPWRADECRRLAADAGNASDKAFWLGLVARWEALEIQKAQQPIREKSTRRRQSVHVYTKLIEASEYLPGDVLEAGEHFQHSAAPNHGREITLRNIFNILNCNGLSRIPGALFAHLPLSSTSLPEACLLVNDPESARAPQQPGTSGRSADQAQGARWSV